MKFALFIGSLLLLSGCTSTMSFHKLGENSFLISREGSNGSFSITKLKAEALADGAAYCTKEGKAFEFVRATDNPGPYIFGNYPRSEVQFTCK